MAIHIVGTASEAAVKTTDTSLSLVFGASAHSSLKI